MRLTALRLALLFGAALLVLGPTTGLTQPGGDGGGFGKGKGGGKKGKMNRDDGGGGAPGGLPGGFGKRGFNNPDGGNGGPGGGFPGGGGFGGFPGGGNFDPSQIASRIFDRYAPGKDVLNISDYQNARDPQAQDKLQAWAQSQGISNGQLTRDQFTQFFTAQMSQRNGGNGPGGSGDLDKDAEDSFRRQDKNSDGFITRDEASRSLGEQFDQWDKNKDGKLDLAEYKEYYKARMASAGGNRPGGSIDASGDGAGTTDPSQELDKRATVYRAGNLPKELPAWFAQADIDRDGQVGLYEWKRMGGDIGLFTEMDKNGDGFLTVEEVLRYQRGQQLAKKGDQGPGSVLAYDEFGEPIEGSDATINPNGFGGRGRGGMGGMGGMGGFGNRGPGGGGNNAFGPGGNGGWGNGGNGGNGQQPGGGRGGPGGGPGGGGRGGRGGNGGPGGGPGGGRGGFGGLQKGQ